MFEMFDSESFKFSAFLRILKFTFCCHYPETVYQRLIVANERRELFTLKFIFLTTVYKWT